MHCANAECSRGLLDLPGGSVWLMQLEVPPDQSAPSDDPGFSMCTLPTKYFWLCADCSLRFVISRWTPSGLVLVRRQPGLRGSTIKRTEDADTSIPFSVHASSQIEEEFLDVG